MEADVATLLEPFDWADAWAMPWVRAVVGLVVLCILMAAGWYVLASFRGYTGHDHYSPHFPNSKLQEMLRRGDISEAEFRTIQSKSHGVSVEPGDPQSPPAPPPTLAQPDADQPVDASRDDRSTEHPHSSLPPFES